MRDRIIQFKALMGFKGSWDDKNDLNTFVFLIFNEYIDSILFSVENIK